MSEKYGTLGICYLCVSSMEVKSKNHNGRGSLFGVPFIVQVPQVGLTYDQLYLIVINRMKRYIKLSQSEDGNSNSIQNQCTNNERDEVESDMETEDGASPTEVNSADNGPKDLFTMELFGARGDKSISKLKATSKTLTLAGNSTHLFYFLF